MSLTDEIRAGNSDAIKQLYQENAQDVYDFAKGITNNHDTAMQATKSTLSKLVEQIQNGSEPANLHSEALKLAYDEACKLAMPSVQNIKSPYDDEEEEPAPVPKKRQAEAPAASRKQTAQRTARRQDDYEDDYDDEDAYEEAPRQQRRQAQTSRGNRQRAEQTRQQPARRSARDEYYDDYDEYEDDYDDYDDYDEKPKHGAGFWICLVINIILLLLLIWFLIGLLINLGVIEGATADNLYRILKFEWFNNTIYPLF